MKPNETEKFQRVGSYYLILIFIIAIVLPFGISLILTLMHGSPFDTITFVASFFGFGVFIWIMLLMLIAWGGLTNGVVKRTAKKVDSLPYHFDSTFTGRAGMLLIDVPNGMIGFISAYNPKKIQVFNASRIDNPRTKASMMTGVRFIFNLDRKKITMYTLLTNRMVSLKSGIGAEAVSKADAFVELLFAAKNTAEMGAAR